MLHIAGEVQVEYVSVHNGKLYRRAISCCKTFDNELRTGTTNWARHIPQVFVAKA